MTQSLSSNQLREALNLRERIDGLQQRLQSILSRHGSGSAGTRMTGENSRRARARVKLPAATRAKIAAAQRARWAKNGSATQQKSGSGKTRNPRSLSPAVRAKIASAARKRWAQRKKTSA